MGQGTAPALPLGTRDVGIPQHWGSQCFSQQEIFCGPQCQALTVCVTLLSCMQGLWGIVLFPSVTSETRG